MSDETPRPITMDELHKIFQKKEMVYGPIPIPKSKLGEVKITPELIREIERIIAELNTPKKEQVKNFPIPKKPMDRS